MSEIFLLGAIVGFSLFIWLAYKLPRELVKAIQQLDASSACASKTQPETLEWINSILRWSWENTVKANKQGQESFLENHILVALRRSISSVRSHVLGAFLTEAELEEFQLGGAPRLNSARVLELPDSITSTNNISMAVSLEFEFSEPMELHCRYETIFDMQIWAKLLIARGLQGTILLIFRDNCYYWGLEKIKQSKVTCGFSVAGFHNGLLDALVSTIGVPLIQRRWLLPRTRSKWIVPHN